jgi:flagellar biosynthesis/type III secretory pathway chaperone
MNLSNQIAKPGSIEAIDQNYQHLVQCLDQLVKIYRVLLDVVRREKDILIASNIDTLSENNRAKEGLLVKVRSLDNQRIKCARDMAHILGTDVERPRLLDMANRLPSERGEKLRTMQSVLELLVKRVAEINKDNEVLVTSALNSISGAMASIKDSLHEKNVYAPHGKMASGTASRALVKREA